jgi:hypothetical protein
MIHHPKQTPSIHSRASSDDDLWRKIQTIISCSRLNIPSIRNISQEHSRHVDHGIRYYTTIAGGIIGGKCSHRNK